MCKEPCRAFPWWAAEISRTFTRSDLQLANLFVKTQHLVLVRELPIFLKKCKFITLKFSFPRHAGKKRS